MKRIRAISILIVAVVMSIIGVTTVAAQAQRSQHLNSDLRSGPAAPSLGSIVTTTFTYQGLIKQSGSPINGNCDLAFGLFDAPSGGSPIGSAITRTLSITNGLFTTGLNFGSNAFDGNGRWLEIAVDCGSGATLLTPRQAVTPAPYALYAIGNWSLNGNAGTNSATNFLGTADNMTLTLGVSNTAAFRIVPAVDTTYGFAPNVIGGFSGNTITPSAVGATIAGGGVAGWPNVISASYAFIGGGDKNTASNTEATIGGGNYNTASGFQSMVGGGYFNTASGYQSMVGGGAYNSASGLSAFVGGGGSSILPQSGNIAQGVAATIGGGLSNTVALTGAYGFIGGGYQNTASGYAAAIGGGYNNTATGNGAFIGGGGYDGYYRSGNNAQGAASTIGGGLSNTITLANSYGFIGGGYQNTASGYDATIAGGMENVASGIAATSGGGFQNTASGWESTVGGGRINTASGYGATIPGGRLNYATMTDTFAAGYQAYAVHQGAFVWADSTGIPFTSTANDQFLIRANGRVGINTNNPTADLTISSSKSISSSFTGIDIYNSSSPAGLTGWRMQVVGSDTPSRVGNFELYYTSPFLVVQPGGNVGVGTTTINDKLQVNGDIRVGTSGTNGCIKGFGGAALTGSCSSDVRLKTNITPFPNMLDKVTALQPVYYNWRADQYPDYHFDGSTRSYGVIAQDVEKVLPELVGTDDHGFKTVNYSEIPVLLLQALKDLRVEKDTQIAAQQKQIDDLQSRLSNMEQNTSPAPFNVFNLISVMALIAVAMMWLQQRKQTGGSS